MGFKTNTDEQVKKYNIRLNQIGNRGIPMAAAATLNNMAFESRKISIKKFEAKRTIRSNWTQRGMLFEKTRQTIPIRKMEARSGSIRDYAKILEMGGTVKPKNKLLEIPALGSRISKSKNKRIAKRFRINNLANVRRLPKIGGSPRRRFAAMLNIARKEKFFGPFLITKQDAGGEKMPVGIFNLSGKGRMRRDGGKITMLRKLKKSAHIAGNPFISPAGHRVGRNMDRIYVRQAQRLLKKFDKNIT